MADDRGEDAQGTTVEGRDPESDLHRIVEDVIAGADLRHARRRCQGIDAWGRSDANARGGRPTADSASAVSVSASTPARAAAARSSGSGKPYVNPSCAQTPPKRSPGAASTDHARSTVAAPGATPTRPSPVSTLTRVSKGSAAPAKAADSTATPCGLSTIVESVRPGRAARAASRRAFASVTMGKQTKRSVNPASASTSASPTLAQVSPM